MFSPRHPHYIISWKTINAKLNIQYKIINFNVAENTRK